MDLLELIAIVVWCRVFSMFTFQACVHVFVLKIRRSLENLPGDRTAYPSRELDHQTIFLAGREGFHPSRRWRYARNQALLRGCHSRAIWPTIEPVSLATASVQDLRCFLGTARYLWLSREERTLILDVDRRANDILAWPDSGGDDPRGDFEPVEPSCPVHAAKER